MSNQSDTPRTDAEVQKFAINSAWVSSAFSRQLERELNDTKKQLDIAAVTARCAYCGTEVLKTAVSMAEHSMSCEKHPIHALIKVKQERDALAAKLDKAMKCAAWLRRFVGEASLDHSRDEIEGAEQALSELEEKK